MAILSNTALANPSRGYDIEQSLRIYGNGTHLTRSPSSSGSLTTWTMSMWVKPDMVPKGAETTSNSPDLTIWSASDADTGGGWTDYFQIKALNATEFAIKWSIAKSGGRMGYLETTRKFRDPSAWYHFVCVWNTGNSTSGDRMRLYVNGIRETAFSSETVPTLNGTTLYTNVGNQDQMIGNYSYYNIPYYSGGQSPANSYIAEVNFIDGQALTPASFGETNSATNQWVPVKYSGSYGTNGYYEKFSATELAASFADSATYHNIHTVTAAGNTHTDTTIKKFGTASGQWDGSGDYLSAPDSNDWCFGDGDWTVDFWLYHTAHPSTDHFDFIISQPNSTSPSGQSYIGTRRDGSGTYYLMGNHSGESNQSNAFSISLDTWTHFAICKDGNQMYFYKDGVSVNGVGNGVTTTVTWPNYNVPLRIGYQQDVEYYNGYADEIRISKGIARYPSGTSFSVATSEYAADKYDVLLLHCNGSDSGTTFTDSSWVGLDGPARHYITANGDVTNTRAQYKIGDSSIKFDGSGDYLSLADSSDWDMMNTTDYTVETWANLTTHASTDFIIGQYEDSNNYWGLYHTDGSGVRFLSVSGGSTLINISGGEITSSGWHHLAAVKDGNDFEVFKDGVSVATGTNSTTDTFSGTLRIGDDGTGIPYDGYLDEIRLSNSARYTANFTPSATAFTADANTKLLIHSDFNGGLGADSSGNENDFSVTNITVSDQVLDSPTRNYSTLNPLINSSGSPAYSEGNLVITPDGSNYSVYQSTISVSSGKWYAEYLVGDTNTFAGVSSADQSASAYGSYWNNTSADFIFFNNNNGNKIIDGAATSYVGAGATVGQIVGVAIDLDGNAINFYINNSAQGSISFSGGVASASSFVFSGVGYAADAERWNFGQDSSFAGAKTAQGNGDDGEDFYYTPPTGYKALNTSNLDDPSIADPTKHFNTKLWTSTSADGTSALGAVTGVGFQPDLVWAKGRSAAWDHNLFNSVMGTGLGKALYTNGTFAAGAYDTSGYGNVTSFDSDGFTVGLTAGNNYAYNYGSGTKYLAWNWKAGGTASSNSDGTITSSVSANTTAGFSIVGYTGHGATTGTVGHGLGVKPDLIITKYRSGAASWSVYNSSEGATKVIWLDDSSAVGTGITYWRDTEPTASVFSVGASGTTGGNANPYIAYCFHSVDGYSKIGTYEGNANANGPFVYTGFKPAVVIAKCVDAVSSWDIVDNKRDPYNGVTQRLFPNNTSADDVSAGVVVDFLSNGFKVRTTSGNWNNATSDTQLYIAFAETPFKTANAR